MDDHSFDPDRLVGTEVVQRYRLKASVATGANAAIFDAWDEEARRHVTVKMIRPELTERSGFSESFSAALDRSSTISHPQLVALFDWGIHTLPVEAGSATGRRSAFTVTERLDGGSLRAVFDRGRRLTPSQALQVGLDICHALAEVHRHGLVHAEVTPAKVLFGADGRARLADLGPAGLLNSMAWDEPSGLDNHVALYASPEQAQGGMPTAFSDVYALSLVLVEALTGSTPFRTDSANATLAARVDRLLPVTAELGPLATVLEHAARPDPDDRSTAVEFGLELVGAARRLPRPEPLSLVLSAPPTNRTIHDEPALAVTEVNAAGASRIPDVEHAPVPPVEPAGIEESSDSGDRPTSSSGVPERVSAVRRPRWALPTTAAVVVVLAVLLARWALITPSHEIPVLTGRVEAEALNIITPFGWDVTIKRERSDIEPEVGTIIATSPVAGIVLAEGEPMTMVVSEGPLLRELPEITGVGEADAVAALTAVGFAPFIETMPNEVIPAGEVISWSVPDDTTLVGGDEAEPGMTVIVVVSSGPAPRSVPDLIGSIVGVARAQLVADGLRIVEDEGVHDDSIPVGQILSQSPAPGSALERGGSVVVTVSLGPDVVTFPSLPTEVSFVDAQRLLIDAGFIVELTLGASDGVVESVSIDGEAPTVGGTYPRDTRVDVVAV